MINIHNQNSGSRKELLQNFRGHLLRSLSVARKSDYPKFNGSIGFTVFENIYAPKKCGVYFVHDLRGILYIGKARNIYSRFTQHTWIRENKDLFKLSQNPFGKLKFSWVNTKDEQTADRLEKKWIRIFKPICCDKYYYKQ
jgi:predicted GIY-YIG superfamily endonuclease|tara:strand:- start:18 stop:437 length:420 start_codon:yes stop_codon:yes gene_type:complete